MPIAGVNDINVYYEIHGKGEPLVLMQCLGANTVDWVLQTPGLSQRYQVLILEGGGHAFSGEIAGQFNREVLDFLGRVAQCT